MLKVFFIESLNALYEGRWSDRTELVRMPKRNVQSVWNPGNCASGNRQNSSLITNPDSTKGESLGLTKISFFLHFLRMLQRTFFVKSFSLTKAKTRNSKSTNKYLNSLTQSQGSCCGLVGRAVASDTSSPRFDSSPRHALLTYVLPTALKSRK